MKPSWLRLERRRQLNPLDNLKIILVAIALSLVFFSIVLHLYGVNISTAYTSLLEFGFYSSHGLNLTIRNMAPILLLILAFGIPARAGIWNVGGEGQFIFGAIAATGIYGLFYNQFPFILLLPMMIFGAMLAGGGWAFIAGFLKGKLGVNDIIVTLMLNFIAIYFMHFLVLGPWMSAEGRVESFPILTSIPALEFGDIKIPITLLIGIGIAICTFLFLERTTLGFKIRSVGSNPLAAKYMGVNFIKITLITMAVGGMLAGIAGLHQLTYVTRLRVGISQNWGYYGIAFWLFANNNPITAIFIAFFFSGLLVGTRIFQVKMGMGVGAEQLFIGICFLVMVGCQFLRLYKIKIR